MFRDRRMQICIGPLEADMSEQIKSEMISRRTALSQAPPEYRAHRRLARRSWRIPALDWHTPLTITLPAPQPMRTCVIMPSGW
jgi:hypothetical protein